MIRNNLRYEVKNANQIYINLNDLFEILQDSEEELSSAGRYDASYAMEKLEEGFLHFGIEVLTNETHSTLDKIMRLL